MTYHFKFLMKVSMLYSSSYCSSSHSSGRLSSTDLTPPPPPLLGSAAPGPLPGDSENRSRTWANMNKYM